MYMHERNYKVYRTLYWFVKICLDANNFWALYIISYHIIYHISYHISYHILSYLILLYYISYVTLCYLMLCYVISYHIISYHIYHILILYYIISYHIILYYDWAVIWKKQPVFQKNLLGMLAAGFLKPPYLSSRLYIYSQRTVFKLPLPEIRSRCFFPKLSGSLDRTNKKR